jgi:hypothetical protein
LPTGPAAGRALTTIHAPEVCRHIFVGGNLADGACWVLNGDSKEVVENMSAVQSFVQ